MNNQISPNAIIVLKILHQHNYEAFLVGGCVRDYLLNKEINDFDITTSALPEQLIKLANSLNFNTIEIGIKHGTVGLIINNEVIECTTYRKDGAYLDSRHPQDVSFTTSLKEDLARRDFTINAICYDGEKIIDHVNGQQDLQAKIIRCIGDANIRFQEDALRILRALRFSFCLNFKIEQQTYQAIKNNALLLNNISKERIHDELIKMMNSDAEDILKELRNSKVLEVIIPEYLEIYDVKQETPYHIYDVFEHTNVALNASINQPYQVRIALLLHDIAKKRHKYFDDKGIAHFKGHAVTSAKMSKVILKRLKFSNSDIKMIFDLIYYHDTRMHDKDKSVRNFLYKLNGNYDLAYLCLLVQKFDNMGKNPNIIKEKNETIDLAINRMKQIKERHDCLTIKDLKIKGNELFQFGYDEKDIGKTLDFLLKYVLNQQECNNHEFLLKIARSKKDEILNRE